MLTIKNLKYTYKKTKQEFCYNLSISAGEIIIISGFSGSGKSTLLDIIAGFLKSDTGTIIYDDNDLSSLEPEARPISILFQNDNLFEHLSVEKNLTLGLESKKLNNEKIITALNEVGLKGFLKRKCNTLSGGQQQRVALARTLLRNKPILLLDEPFAALDEETTKNIRSLLKNLVKKHQWHAIIVSHNKFEASQLKAKNYTMTDGKLGY